MRGQWLHVLCTGWLTFYHTSERRGSVLEGLRGCLVHDHLKSYFKIADVRLAPCNAQHLRELQALAELDGEARAGPLQQLLRTAGQAAPEYREGLGPLPRAGPKGRKKRRPGYSLRRPDPFGQSQRALRDRTLWNKDFGGSGTLNGEWRPTSDRVNDFR